jgi:hypothetical protein
MSAAVMDLRSALAYAVKLVPKWADVSEDTWLRWLKRQLEEEPKLLFRMTPGKKARYWVRKGPLDRLLGDEKGLLDAKFSTIECRMEILEERVNYLSVRQLSAPAPQKSNGK